MLKQLVSQMKSSTLPRQMLQIRVWKMCLCQGFVEQQANCEQLNNLTGIGAVRLIDCTIAPQSSMPLRLLASLTPPLRQFHTEGFRLCMGGS